MYIGHVGIALALRAPRDGPPLWLIVPAVQGPDWVDTYWKATDAFPTATWMSHGFPMLAAGAATMAVIAAIVARWRGEHVARAAAIVGIAYLSHWLADFPTGIKPTWPGGPRVGLDLYGWPGRDFVLEAVVVIIGWWLWNRTLPTRRRSHALALALLGALLFLQATADLVMTQGTHVL